MPESRRLGFPARFPALILHMQKQACTLHLPLSTNKRCPILDRHKIKHKRSICLSPLEKIQIFPVVIGSLLSQQVKIANGRNLMGVMGSIRRLPRPNRRENAPPAYLQMSLSEIYIWASKITLPRFALLPQSLKGCLHLTFTCACTRNTG